MTEAEKISAQSAEDSQAAQMPPIKSIIGRKIGMTRIMTKSGTVIPITVIKAGPCVIVDKKDIGRDGYHAVQLGFEPVRKERLNKCLRGHYEKRGVKPMRILREFRVKDTALFQVGQTVSVGVFQEGDRVDIQGTSRGKGFQGVMKRHKFAGGPASHGQSDRQRSPGSIGGSSFPSRVFPGTRMAGHMGAEAVTMSRVLVVGVRKEEDMLLVKGAVPGPRNGIVLIRPTKKFVRQAVSQAKADDRKAASKGKAGKK